MSLKPNLTVNLGLGLSTRNILINMYDRLYILISGCGKV